MLIRFDWLRELVDLPDDAESAAGTLTGLGLEVGSLEAWGETTLLDIDLTPNRGDAMSHRGVAREMAAALDTDLAPLDTSFAPADGTPGDLASVTIEDPDLCSRYTARLATGIAMGTSPPWLEDRLESLGLRAVNNVVDATNYVLLETGQPMHAFDLDLLAGRAIIVRRARAGEKLVTLDEVEHELCPDDLVIADAEKPVALAGIMGGLDTMISGDTSRILLESAWFDPRAVRATARRLGVRTDASVRFERGCDPRITLPAADRFCRIMEEHMGGGRFLGDPIDVVAREAGPRTARLRWERAEEIMGCPLDRPRLEKVLERLGFETKDGGSAAPVYAVPTWRPDVTREIDLVEEVARHQGFASIPTTLPASPGTVPARDPLAVRRERLRDVCASAGFLEAVSYSFIDEPSDRAWRYRGEVEETAPVIVNPLVQHQRVMRGSLVPGLLQAASRNQARGEATLRLFEFGKRFWAAGDAPAEEWTAGFLMQGEPPGSVSWQSARTAVDFYDIKGALLQILEAGGMRGATCRSEEFPFLHPAESAGLTLGGALLGPLGRLHPDLEKTHDLEGPVYVAELDLGPLLRAEDEPEGVAPPSRFPWADRDLSLLLPSEVTYDQVVASIRSLGQEALSEIRALDRYSGKGVPDGRISLTVRLRYQRTDRTLEAEEASALTDAVVQCLCKDLGAELRS